MSQKLVIDSNSQTPIFQQIVDDVENKILAGELGEGDFLTSVRDFAVTNTVNPNTVAKAYQILQSMDLVEPVRGKGLKVKKIKNRVATARRDDLISEKINELLILAESLKISKEILINLIKTKGRKHE